MGNIFYSIATGLWPFENENVGRTKIKDGQRPDMKHSKLNEKNPFDQTFQKIIDACERGFLAPRGKVATPLLLDMRRNLDVGNVPGLMSTQSYIQKWLWSGSLQQVPYSKLPPEKIGPPAKIGPLGKGDGKRTGTEQR